MAQVVLDTSVIAKLFLKEEGSGTATAFKDSYIKGKIDIVMPSLVKYELMNVLKYKGFTKREIIEALEVIRDYGFLILELEDAVINRTAEISVDYDISAYDATFIAFAQDVGAMLYTADRKLLAKVRQVKFVKHFSEFVE
ncbi:MAG: type II toxin-antitoxin system VapC family toxin [Candidatus Micrarchaeaceae archaeon]|jgi:predicted nucleic acid-binding protein|nr:type II toxin-antitoxin system VapC family toxin [Candidatus Micrarchaeota archaeon]